MSGFDFPVYLRLVSFSLHPHLVFEILAYFVGFRIFVRNREARGDVISLDQRLVLICAAAGGALLGSRILGLLESESFWVGETRAVQDYLQYKTIVGGLLGGTLGVELVKLVLKIKRSTGDLFVVPLIVAICIGRVGCFLSGLEDGTYGSPTGLPLGVDFGDGVSRHPTALYEILALLCIGVSVRLNKAGLARTNGLQFKWFLFWYLTFRVAVDTLKPTYKIALDLSAIQIASFVAVLIYGYRIYQLASKDRPHAV